jgi:hypothetical protein
MRRCATAICKKSSVPSRSGGFREVFRLGIAAEGYSELKK